MSIQTLGHNFRPYGSEEMICNGCDFVIWPVLSPAEAENAVKMLGGGSCPAAIAMEARRAETPGGSVHDSAGLQGIAPQSGEAG